ncbi:hypothetical protein [Pseudonocardia sp. GCM10023141]|uniref:hypothetical protein n=1 Tax=Pseudonocardia sp. GCM10023141 TaxID=3252653 RepID=UPI0036137B7B
MKRSERDLARVDRRAVVLALAVVLQIVVAAATADALGVPGSDSSAAKLAEWGRDHGMNGLVSWLEALQYDRDPPRLGGVPAGGIPLAAGAVPATRPGDSALERLPEPLVPLADGPRLPGEGVWTTVVAAGGKPAVQVAELRPDPQHTSFVVGVMRMDPALVRGELHPGTRDPGGTWQAATSLAGAAGTNLAAVFNGGFRLNDPSHNGYLSEGRTVAPLVPGAASLVIYTDGRADVGSWGREVRMTPQVASVRQNLQLLVDGGQVAPSCATGGQAQWGNTLGQAAFIQRSAFGITAGGLLVYVGGPALSVCSLGAVLRDAGVTRGMELDINPDWVSGAYFTGAEHGTPQGFRLFPAEKVPPDHYFAPSSRDFFAWYLRP